MKKIAKLSKNYNKAVKKIQAKAAKKAAKKQQEKQQKKQKLPQKKQSLFLRNKLKQRKKQPNKPKKQKQLSYIQKRLVSLIHQSLKLTQLFMPSKINNLKQNLYPMLVIETLIEMSTIS